ncbi:GGDEF domain-containing protein [Rhizobium sp. ARZ01]|uniref:GGDEF domain-containing protein n=1 Tax=Rhizobium sp. ARZ01 TaxID=2769313 RepID=UPI0017868A35|nr:GGDEF domain-containing protein [Rhizobium sp. ARZ01]MBD9375684.1 GGDEF domain-containing protein [Rhizobium sp. ARZ01]
MSLDFQTLYLIILLNSVVLCVVWSGFVWVHRNIDGAGYWLAACLLTTLGGVLFALETVVAANACTVLGFCLAWTGIRRFQGEPAAWRAVALIVLAGTSVLALVGDNRPAINVAIAVFQVIPMALAIAALKAFQRPSLGAIAATFGFVVAFTGQGTEAVLNIMRLTGSLSTERYYDIAAFLLVAAIFGATVWNLGFVLMAVDRLASDLIRLASFDELTGLPNRRNFMETAGTMKSNAARLGVGFGVMIIDIDRFKTINDTHGHAAGDACLQHFSELAQRIMGPEHFLGRLARDEFGIAFVVKDPAAVRRFADHFAGTVAASRFDWLKETIPLSISVGVALRPAGDVALLKTIIEEADMALYETKRRGRNGFTIASGRSTRKGPEPWATSTPLKAANEARWA